MVRAAPVCSGYDIDISYIVSIGSLFFTPEFSSQTVFTLIQFVWFSRSDKMLQSCEWLDQVSVWFSVLYLWLMNINLLWKLCRRMLWAAKRFLLLKYKTATFLKLLFCVFWRQSLTLNVSESVLFYFLRAEFPSAAAVWNRRRSCRINLLN